ncbi:hypothetical protein DGG96_01465 [Legionella qingyii]|uniref:Uncharacterized protein n=1 Tax=Legionella qingyii TaxID=2184757 RepID=A0A317U733_9GAMM|nr:hypothetical protein [Legionella qingyii]PWY57411.1 hypothetical protein DGG96_01465 [Legionella qingyii]RUR26494.1 hypothetical protein ELY20_00835 [Legionella qingyii]RUR27514.1 hypothetical protein ELY16_05180 [Legionella qingyii]
MPKKKSLKIPKEFVEQVVAIIANESEEGRKKIVAIAQRAEKNYQRPVKSWLTGWVYQYTRTRGEKIEQSINVMKDFPDAFTRLQELKLMISDGEWNVNSSYNYFLFLELIDAVPDYQVVEDAQLPKFIMELKEEVLIEINSFMAQYKATLEDKKNREIERQAALQKALQASENVLVFNNLAAAKEQSSAQQDKVVFTLSYKNSQWQLSWVDATGEVYPLTPSEELSQKLATFENRDVEKLNSVHLKQIKRECLKAREEYLAKIQLLINPENPKTNLALTNEDLAVKGITSTFVLRHTEKEGTSLWWINSMGSANKISLTDYPKLDSWLANQKGAFKDADVLQLKAYLLQLNTAQSIASSKLDKMNSMFSQILQNKNKQNQQAVDEMKKTAPGQGRINMKKFALIEKHLKSRIENVTTNKPILSKEEVVDETDTEEKSTFSKQEVVKETTVEHSKKLDKNRYEALSQLPTFWQQRKIAAEQSAIEEMKSLTNG